MKQEFLKQTGASRLLIFFAGWGMDARPFTALHATQEEDIMICYDYRTDNFRTDLLSGYTSVRILAWSMGVWMSMYVWSRMGQKLPGVQSAIALNGTPFPIDTQRGIDPRVFRLTLHSLIREEAVLKFYERMYETDTGFQNFLNKRPQRSVNELREELKSIADRYEKNKESIALSAAPFLWKRAFISQSDRIFPASAQQTAWRNTTEVSFLKGGHWPFPEVETEEDERLLQTDFYFSE